MFFTCSPSCTATCTDPLHQHGKARSAAASVASATARASRPVARTRTGKSKVVDLHCHYLNPVVNAKTAHLNPAQYDPTTVFADDLTRQTNVKQMKTRAPKLTGVTERLVDMDRMGVDIQAICPAPYHFFYWTEADYGAQLAREVTMEPIKARPKYSTRATAHGRLPAT